MGTESKINRFLLKRIFMEQKKTLWIVAASGIFLLVVVGAAMILYSRPMKGQGIQHSGFDPSTGWISSTMDTASDSDKALAFNTERPAPNMPTQPVNPQDFAQKNEMGLPSHNEEKSEAPIHTDKLTVISDSATVYSTGTTTIDLNSLKSSSNTNIVAKNEKTAEQINTNRTTEALPPRPDFSQASASRDDYYTPAPKAAVTKKSESSVSKSSSTTKAVAKSTPAPKKSTPAKSTAKAATSSKSSTAARVAANTKKARNSFWVQAAAYTSKRNADEARTTLESNKIPSEVFTFTDSKGKTFYRVRVGPYVTKSEAEYWQSRIGMIDKFANAKSVIVNTAVN